MSVEIKGLNSLMSKLSSLGGNVNQAMYRGIGQGLTVIEGDAKELCPVMNGELRDSIHTDLKQENGITGTVGTNKEYAVYVEYGTGQRGESSPSPPKAPLSGGYREDWAGMDAQPYLYPALMQNKDTVKEMCAKELSNEIRRLGG